MKKNHIGLIALLLLNCVLLYHSDVFLKIYHLLTPHPTIVFFGDSRIVNNKWEWSFLKLNVRSVGFAGFTTTHFLILENKEVIALHPKACVLEFGLNDFTVKTPLLNAEQNYRQLLDTMLMHHIAPIVESIIYINKKGDTAANKYVASLNSFLEQTCLEKHITYIDLNAVLSSKNGQLQLQYCIGDGVHLNKEGYRRWCTLLAPYLYRYTE
jgi:lysophospholipase L1-like esterase